MGIVGSRYETTSSSQCTHSHDFHICLIIGSKVSHGVLRRTIARGAELEGGGGGGGGGWGGGGGGGGSGYNHHTNTW